MQWLLASARWLFVDGSVSASRLIVLELLRAYHRLFGSYPSFLSLAAVEDLELVAGGGGEEGGYVAEALGQGWGG